MFINGKKPINPFKYTIDNKEVTEQEFIEYTTNQYRKFYQNLKSNLLDLGFKVDTKGFRYWIKAIEIYKTDGWRYGFTMKYLYDEIAREFGTTETRVERALRTTYNTSKDKIKNKYHYNGKITNKTILELFCNYNIDNIDNHIPRID